MANININYVNFNIGDGILYDDGKTHCNSLYNKSNFGTFQIVAIICIDTESILNTNTFSLLTINDGRLLPNSANNSQFFGNFLAKHITRAFPEPCVNYQYISPSRASYQYIKTGLEFVFYSATVNGKDISNALLSISVQMTKESASANITLAATDDVVMNLNNNAVIDIFMNYEIEGNIVYSQPLFLGNLSSFTLYRGASSGSITATVKGIGMDYGGSLIKLDSVEMFSSTGDAVQFNLPANKGIMIGDVLEYENEQYKVQSVTLSISPELKRLTVKAL